MNETSSFEQCRQVLGSPSSSSSSSSQSTTRRPRPSFAAARARMLRHAARAVRDAAKSRARPTWCATMTTSTDVEVDAYKVGESTNIKWHEGAVDRATREKTLGQKGCVLWFTGLSGSGKSTVAYTLEHELFKRGKVAQVLDGDNIRHGLNSNLGFTAADREENIRRIGEVSKLYADSGMITLVSFISPYKKDRQRVRERVGDRFVEVYMKIPLSVCEERDPKGLYKAARAGKIKGFTGIDDPYEEPENAEIEMVVAEADGVMASPMEMSHKIIDILEAKGFLKA
jgi:adenylylsulfate kinase